MAWEPPHGWEHNHAAHWANHTDHMPLKHGPLSGAPGAPVVPQTGALLAW